MGLSSSLLISPTDPKFRPSKEQLFEILKSLQELKWLYSEKIWKINCIEIYNAVRPPPNTKPIFAENMTELLIHVQKKYSLKKGLKLIPIAQTPYAKEELESLGIDFGYDKILENSALKIGGLRKQTFFKYEKEKNGKRGGFEFKIFNFCFELFYTDTFGHPKLYTSDLLLEIKKYPFLINTFDRLESICGKPFDLYYSREI
jgi:hypothetical protein